MRKIYKDLNSVNITKDKFRKLILEDAQYNTMEYHFKNLFTQVIRVSEFDEIIQKMCMLVNACPSFKRTLIFEKPTQIEEQSNEILRNFTNGNCTKLRELVEVSEKIYNDFVEVSKKDKKMFIFLGKYMELFNKPNSELRNPKQFVKKVNCIIDKISKRYKKIKKNDDDSLSRFIAYHKKVMEKYENGQDIRNFNFFLNLQTIKVELEDFFDKGFVECMIVKDLLNVYDTLEQSHDLTKTCYSIRDVFKPNGFHSSLDGVDICDKGFRTKLLGDPTGDNHNAFFNKTCHPSNISEEFQKLSNTFKNILLEENIDEYIKKTARFYFDFLLLHPFSDGNGRTARILTIMMLNHKGINLTSLFAGNLDNYTFNITIANKALDNDYTAIENRLYDIIFKRCNSTIFNSENENKRDEYCEPIHDHISK